MFLSRDTDPLRCSILMVMSFLAFVIYTKQSYFYDGDELRPGFGGGGSMLMQAVLTLSAATYAINAAFANGLKIRMG